MDDVQPEVDGVVPTAIAGVTPFKPDPHRQYMLIGGYLVFFLRYIVATFLSAFFGPYASGVDISDEWQGIIFAVFPVGLTITAAVAPPLILRLGTRMAVFWGMMGTALFTVIFGFIPDIVDSFEHADDTARKNALVAGYMFTYFMNGLVGGLAETGTTILITNKFVDKIGVVSASIATACSLGCIAGPPIGGVLYHLPTLLKKSLDLDEELVSLWAFRGPFLVTGVLIFVLSIYIFFYFGNVTDADQGDEEDEGRSSVRSVLNKSRVITLIAMALSGTFVAALDPTLANKLTAEPFDMSEPQIGLVFMISSLGQIGLSLPIGWITDKMSKRGRKTASRVNKLLQGGGFYVLFLTFFLLGPFEIGDDKIDDKIERTFNKSLWVWVAMVLKGVGSAGNNAAYPDLAIGVQDGDTRTHATLSGLWNAAYGIGWAAGPFAGGLLAGRYGFAGFATVIALWSLSYAVVMTFAAVCCEPSMSKKPSRMPASGLSQPSRSAVYEDTPLLGGTMNYPGNDDSDRLSIN